MAVIKDTKIAFQCTWGNKTDKEKETRFILELPTVEIAATAVLTVWMSQELDMDIILDDKNNPIKMGKCYPFYVGTIHDSSAKITFRKSLEEWPLTGKQQSEFAGKTLTVILYNKELERKR